MFRSVDQENFSKLIAAHIHTQDAPLLLEGATGIGKTRSYLKALMPAASVMRVAIVLPSHQLIDQLLNSTDLSVIQLPGVSVHAFRPRRMFASLAAYNTNKAAAMNAEIMLCTSASVIIDQRLGGEYNGATLRDYILFDEADQLPSAAALQSDYEITHAQLNELGITAKNAMQTVSEVLAKRSVEPEVKAAALIIREALTENFWFQKVVITDQGGLLLFHKLPGRLLKKIANQKNIAFVSATLTVRSNFEDFCRALGIQNTSHLSAIIEPKQHGSLSFHVEEIDRNSDEWLPLTVATIEACANNGFVLVVTPSHALANKLGAAIPQATVRLSGDVAETTTEAVARMGDSKILIAAGAWAGFDTFVRWSHIVIPQIPFQCPIVSREEVDEDTSLDAERGTNVESSYVDARNVAVRRMRQVIGRGLRSPDAVCEVHILDKRYASVGGFVPSRFLENWNKRQVEFTAREGARQELVLNSIERSSLYRAAAIKHYGLKCMACGRIPKTTSEVDVHHINPIANGERITKIHDLAVLCPNHHRLAHTEEPPISIERLREMVASKGDVR